MRMVATPVAVPPLPGNMTNQRVCTGCGNVSPTYMTCACSTSPTPMQSPYMQKGNPMSTTPSSLSSTPRQGSGMLYSPQNSFYAEGGPETYVSVDSHPLHASQRSMLSIETRTDDASSCSTPALSVSCDPYSYEGWGGAEVPLNTSLSLPASPPTPSIENQMSTVQNLLQTLSTARAEEVLERIKRLVEEGNVSGDAVLRQIVASVADGVSVVAGGEERLGCAGVFILEELSTWMAERQCGEHLLLSQCLLPSVEAQFAKGLESSYMPHALLFFMGELLKVGRIRPERMVSFISSLHKSGNASPNLDTQKRHFAALVCLTEASLLSFSKSKLDSSSIGYMLESARIVAYGSETSFVV